MKGKRKPLVALWGKAEQKMPRKHMALRGI